MVRKRGDFALLATRCKRKILIKIQRYNERFKMLIANGQRGFD